MKSSVYWLPPQAALRSSGSRRELTSRERLRKNFLFSSVNPLPGTNCMRECSTLPVEPKTQVNSWPKRRATKKAQRQAGFIQYPA